MPRGHEYHQPNAPDTHMDEQDSDIELDLHELGPLQYIQNGSSNSRQERAGLSRTPESQIPLRSIPTRPLRASGRRNRRQEDETEERDIGVEPDGLEDHSIESTDGFNIGDSTPLLNLDANGKPTAPTARRMADRMGLSGFRSRRSGYVNIQEPPPEAAEETAKSKPRSIIIGQYPPPRFPPNAISNAKYTPWSFLPRTLYNEFSFFINLYFLIVALSQLIPPLRIGVLWTYMAPLAFVLTITLGKEAYDDIARRKRDAEANKELYTILRLRDSNAQPRGKKSAGSHSKNSKQGRAMTNGQRRLNDIEIEEEEVGGSLIEVEEVRVKSKDIKVGDVLKLGKDDRVPADVVILKCFTAESAATNNARGSSLKVEQSSLLFEQGENNTVEEASDGQHKKPIPQPLPTSDGGGVGETFIRTDQLDGETDWKLRIASSLTQSLEPGAFTRLTIVAGKPSKKVNEFVGRIELQPSMKGQKTQGEDQAQENSQMTSAPLSIDNTAWANTVLASNAIVLAVVVYTGAQTRQALSTAPSRSKTGLLELEINNLTKFLCILTVTLSGILVGLEAYYHQLTSPWYVSICRFLILFSSIIPISLRVNLDLGKTVYAYYIQHDKEMPEAVVRTSTIPEDLGRIEYLLSDKTGTLTQNGESTNFRSKHC